MPPEKYENVSSNWRIKLHHYVQDNAFNLLRQNGLRGVGYLDKALKILVKLPAVNGPVIIRTREGFLIRVDPSFDHGLEKNIYETGTYESGTLYLIHRLLRPGDCFIDIGANIGLMSLKAAQTVGPGGRVYSFEPVPSTYEILEYNAQLNGFGNLTACNLAMGSSIEELVIFENTNHNRGGATLVGKGERQNGIKVKVDTLDNFLAVNNIHKVRLIKLDVEGWEFEVLSGGTGLLQSESAPIIIAEYSKKSEKAKSILDLIENANKYEIYILKRGKEIISPLCRVQSRDKLHGHDNIICMLQSHREELPAELFA